MAASFSVSPEKLDELEKANHSEQQIADIFGISRMWLYKYRKRIS